MDELFLSDLSPKDKTWDVHKRAADMMQALLVGTPYDKHAQRMRECAERLMFVLRDTEGTGELTLKLHSAKFCRVPRCPNCMWRRCLMWRARFFKAIPRIVHDFPNANYVLLTLTVKNCPVSELRTQLQAMNEGWRRMMNLKVFPAIGFVRATEVTRNHQTGEAHPHFHCLLMLPASYYNGQSYVKHEQWREWWKNSMRLDYDPIVNIKRVKARKKTRKFASFPLARLSEGQAKLAQAIVETCKYGVKETDLVWVDTQSSYEEKVINQQWLLDLADQLHNIKLISLGGHFRTYLSELEPEDLIHADENEELEASSDLSELYFDWKRDAKRYLEKREFKKYLERKAAREKEPKTPQ